MTTITIVILLTVHSNFVKQSSKFNNRELGIDRLSKHHLQK